MTTKPKIFIAGHNGMVGSALARHLKVQNVEIITKDRAELDLLNQDKVYNFFKDEKIDEVYLAAAKVGGIHANNTYRADFIYQNLTIQTNVIHSSFLNGVKKLLFLGSSCIYPKNANQPVKEEELLTGKIESTNEPYAVAKIAGIKMCESYNLQYGTNFISVMPTNLYGPNDNFDLEKSHVLPALIRKIYLGKCLQQNEWNSIKSDLDKNPIEGIKGDSNTDQITDILSKYGVKEDSIEIWGSGKPKREFLWSEDMADACVYLLENRHFSDTFNSENTEIRNTHINIGTGVDISIKELAEEIKSIIGYKGSFIFNTLKPDGTMKKLTDVSKLNSLGWKHKVSLEKGVEKMYLWYLS